MDTQYQSQSGYEDREQDARRERREEYTASYQPAPTSSLPLGSPSSAPNSTSPFAFAPPPLSARPSIQMSHSDPSHSYPYYNQRPPMPTHNSYPYTGSASMGYRSYSNESGQRVSPQNGGLSRTPSSSMIPSLPSPTTGNTNLGVQQLSSPYPYQRQMSGSGASYASSPQRAPIYPNGYYVPQAADMPRSLSYPSYAQPYPSPQYHMPPIQHQGTLMRHNTTPGMELGMEMGARPSMGYSFANRLPLVDRPFKCDECVQSFNRNHDLKRHKRIHLAVKPFGCDKCGKTFSRKDALRRHWLVKGCRGEEGATAPIVPMFPINVSRPNLSPPGSAQVSPTETDGPRSYPIHDAPPLALSGLHHETSDTQIILTPDELAAQGGASRAEPIIASGEDHMYEANHGCHRGSGSPIGEGYFEGVVGIKHDGTAAMMEGPGKNSPYSKYPSSPASATHYRRDGNLASPSGAQPSPTNGYVPNPVRSYSPSSLGPEGKPVFAMPFAPAQAGYSQQDALLGPPDAPRMEKQGSSDGDPTTWQRWHRPSFPFPPPPGSNYNIEPASPLEAAQAQTARPSFSQ